MMVQSLSVSTLTASINSGICGSKTLWQSDNDFVNKNHINIGIGRKCLWHHCALRLFFTSCCDRSRRRNLRVQAGWMFKGSDQGMQASSERSESVNEEILIFYFQLDLATRIQFALNMEQYEVAQQIRNKLTEVEAVIIKQQEARRGLASKCEAQDKAISILRLRADMQTAIESENYAFAAELRNEISKLEAESLAASVKAVAYESTKYQFCLGQKVRHKKLGYRAVVCGMDSVCCESSSWMEVVQVDKLPRGSNQSFYQVLVDVNGDPNIL